MIQIYVKLLAVLKLMELVGKDLINSYTHDGFVLTQTIDFAAENITCIVLTQKRIFVCFEPYLTVDEFVI